MSTRAPGSDPSWTLAAASARHASGRPDHVAILCEDREVTYGELHRETNRIAHRLLAEGIGRGDRVAHLGKESERYYEIALACSKMGAVFVPINWRLTADEVAHVLQDSRAAVVFAEREYARVVDELGHGHGRALALDDGDRRGGAFEDWKRAAPTDELEPVTGPDDPTLILYTSGTTGLPKGVVVAQRAFFTLPVTMRAAGVAWIDWLPEDRSLISLPGLGIAGMAWFMHGFNAGATNVVMRMYISEEAVRLIETVGITITFVAPAMLQMMLDEPAARPEAFRSLRKVSYGAAPISPSLLERGLEVMGCEFAQIYASTETGTVAVCLPPEDHTPGSPRLRSAGRVCPGHELKIIDGSGCVVGPGEIGQVCVRTPAHMIGYWERPEATAEALVDGWLHMQDAGYLDEHGYLHLADRINDTIIQAGQNIYPAEVERVLGDHPDVAEVAVIGVPHPLWGDAVLACVVRRPGADPDPRELASFLNGRLAPYKIPTEWEFVDRLPRNPSGKVLRRVLRDERSQMEEVP